MKKKKVEGKVSQLKQQTRKEYIAPTIVVMQIEVEQNVLSSGSGDLPGLGGEDW